MHPDVVQIGPGDCPVCGMALEPMDVFDASPEEDPELRRFAHSHSILAFGLWSAPRKVVRSLS